jgi:hypothetical protein
MLVRVLRVNFDLLEGKYLSAQCAASTVWQIFQAVQMDYVFATRCNNLKKACPEGNKDR